MTTKTQQLADQLEATKARIVEARLLSWSSASNSEPIKDVKLAPLTARAWVDLRLVENAFFTGDDPCVFDVIGYYWRNSPKYRPEGGEKLKEALAKDVARADLTEAICGVFEHLNTAFEEVPSATQKSVGLSRSNKMPAVDSVVAAIDEVAHRYGQNPNEVIDWPLSRIFQLQRAARMATIPDYNLKEPESVREIKRQLLAEINNGKN